MKKDLQTKFSTRQYMISRDFEIYYYRDADPLKVKVHTHNYYEFYFFLEGDISIQIEEDLHRLRYGDLVMIPPGTPHHAVIHSTEKLYRRFVFWISREYLGQLMEQSPDYGYLIQHVSVSKEYIFHQDMITFNTIQSKIFGLIEEVHTQRFGKEAKVLLCVNDLVLTVNRIVYESKHPKVQKEEGSLYQNLLDYIEGHLDEELTLEHLAREFFVSKYHIAHIFKDNIGISIHQYITKKRVAACRNAILDNAKISSVYLQFGFKDYASFYRAFRKEYGLSPKEYKETRKREQSCK